MKHLASMRDLTLASRPLESASRDRPDAERHSNKPDSSGLSSSDGDDPPLRRPRQAGFIAWPLVLLLGLICLLIVIPIGLRAAGLPIAFGAIENVRPRPSPTETHLVRLLLENIRVFHESVNEETFSPLQDQHSMFVLQAERSKRA